MCTWPHFESEGFLRKHSDARPCLKFNCELLIVVIDSCVSSLENVCHKFILLRLLHFPLGREKEVRGSSRWPSNPGYEQIIAE